MMISYVKINKTGKRNTKCQKYASPAIEIYGYQISEDIA